MKKELHRLPLPFAVIALLSFVLTGSLLALVALFAARFSNPASLAREATPIPMALPLASPSPSSQVIAPLPVLAPLVQELPITSTNTSPGWIVSQVSAAPPSFQEYKVHVGDTLTALAARFGASVEDLKALNGLANSNYVQVGQVLKVRRVEGSSPEEKLVPDSEAVYSPAFEHFDVKQLADQQGGYLARYTERVEGMTLSGPQIIQLVAERFSVGPRVLLTLLELQGGWVTGKTPTAAQLTFPFGYVDSSHSGLYKQANWAANALNDGYYGRTGGTFHFVTLKDGHRLHLPDSLNAGTAGIQLVLALESGSLESWLKAIGPNGFRATYQRLFGDPFANAIEPLTPADLTQPTLHLPWEDGHLWFYTGGPHGGWADGSARAAVDFAPKGWNGSCMPSVEWAISAAQGQVVAAEHGRVMVNLSGSSFQGRGWTLMYMHMATPGRVPVGKVVQTGDPIGHPSCEGGYSIADHLHFARLYNGQWIPADDKQAPMVISGWKVHSLPQEYEGTIARGSESHTALDGQIAQRNGIIADEGGLAAEQKTIAQANASQPSTISLTPGGQGGGGSSSEIRPAIEGPAITKNPDPAGASTANSSAAAATGTSRVSPSH